jgi:ADP-heptose:LPS heptosyltransferase
VLGLTIATAIKKQYPEDNILYSTPPKSVPWAECFVDDVIKVPIGAVYRHKPDCVYDLNTSYNLEMKEKSERGGRIFYYREQAEFVIPEPLKLKEAPPSPFGKAIILAPYSAWPGRTWSLMNWLQLEKSLRNQGHRIVVLHERFQEIKDFQSEKAHGRTPLEVCAIVRDARFLVGCESGMCHLAGALNTSALALCGPTDGNKIFNNWQSVHFINGPLPCSGCYWQEVPQCCHSHCASLNQIHPDLVVKNLAHILPKIL